jgi:hypothetical protein
LRERELGVRDSLAQLRRFVQCGKIGANVSDAFITTDKKAFG